MGDNRQTAFNRLHRRVEAREADRVEINVGALHDAEERRPLLPGDQKKETLRVASCLLECALEAMLDDVREPLANIRKEHEPCPTETTRDLNIDVVVFRHVFVGSSG